MGYNEKVFRHNRDGRPKVYKVHSGATYGTVVELASNGDLASLSR